MLEELRHTKSTVYINIQNFRVDALYSEALKLLLYYRNISPSSQSCFPCPQSFCSLLLLQISSLQVPRIVFYIYRISSYLPAPDCQIFPLPRIVPYVPRISVSFSIFRYLSSS
jgi:hypothetical protein